MKPVMQVPGGVATADVEKLEADGWLVIRTPEAASCLAVFTPTASGVAPAAPEIEMPPDEVLVAIQTISPVRDATYDANWAHWEKHKARARAHPAAFAKEILDGEAIEVPA